MHKQMSMVALIVLAVVVAAGAQAPAPPPAPEGPQFIVTYLEVAPSSENQAATVLKAYRDATRREQGNTRVEVLQRANRPGQFAVVEEWRGPAEWKTHRQAPHTTHFQDALKPLRVSPYDERTHGASAVAPSGATVGGTVVVLTHVDVIPPNQVQVREMLKTLAETSRKEAGNVRFDVLQGVRQNHFTVVEGWRDGRAYEAHITAAHTRAFRDELQPRATDGSPYDERLYRLVP